MGETREYKPRLDSAAIHYSGNVASCFVEGSIVTLCKMIDVPNWLNGFNCPRVITRATLWAMLSAGVIHSKLVYCLVYPNPHLPQAKLDDPRI